MVDNKPKSYKPHIKVYFDDEKEEKEVRLLAKDEGLSASAWFRSWALKQLKKKGSGSI